MSTKIAVDTSAPTEQRLHGNLGVVAISFMVIAGAAPLTVVGGPMAMGLAIGNGAGLPTAFLATTIVLLLFAIGFTAMTPFIHSAGAFYAYVQAGLGRVAGIGTGYAALLSYVSIYIGLYVLFGTGLGALVETFDGPNLPWWMWASAGLAVVSFLGYRNIELSGKVLGVLLVAAVAIVLVLDARIVAHGGGSEGLSHGFSSLSTVLSGAPGVALLFAVLSFIGIEAAVVFRDEARDPARHHPVCRRNRHLLCVHLLGDDQCCR
ncbi:APC family permease [Mycolicibacterium houstonense]|uniref:APC family permease n=1 Tax=Mycolicibacterium houstonense TaxID=146021 RepID=UPI000A915FD1|nr:APC family permease [Mycolicibacterium houstonense]